MNLALIRLLHLASPTLPVGAYTYSQGLEWAVESGAIRNEASAGQWISDCLSYSLASFEAVYLAHMLSAWRNNDAAQLAELDAEFIASRETAELRAETLQMGHSLTKLLRDLSETHRHPGAGRDPVAESVQTLDTGLRRYDGNFKQDPSHRHPGAGRGPVAASTQTLDTGECRYDGAPDLAGFPQTSFPLAWSCAAAHWQIESEDAISGYLWAWLENQVMAALKAVPLGQTAGQRLLLSLGERLPELAKQAAVTPLDQARNFLPAFAIASSLHETQYTRIFRS
jgi:urease accessory protein